MSDRASASGRKEDDRDAVGTGTERVVTTRFGELDVPVEQIVEFPWGLVGLGHLRRFVIVDSGGGGPFHWLQSAEVPELAFVVAESAEFFENYDVPVGPETAEALRLRDEDDALVLLILTISREHRTVTANLKGPVVINQRERIGRQLVLQTPEYATKHPLPTRSRAEGCGPDGSREGRQRSSPRQIEAETC